MADRVASDHPSVETVRATVRRRGGTSRRILELPASVADLVSGGLGRVVIKGTEFRSPIQAGPDGGFRILGAYPNARRARTRAGTDALDRWLRDHDLGPGRTVAFDVPVPAFRYGIRLPSDRPTYDTSEPPAQGLRDIAERLDGG